MNTKDNGGPAFPGTEHTFYDGVPQVGADHQGMSLRDWFAGQALAGLIANPNRDATRGKKGVEPIAQYAYEYADAMLEARKK